MNFYGKSMISQIKEVNGLVVALGHMQLHCSNKKK